MVPRMAHTRAYKAPTFNMDDGPRKFMLWKRGWEAHVDYLSTVTLADHIPATLKIELHHALSPETMEWLEAQDDLDLTNIDAIVNALEAHIMATAQPVTMLRDAMSKRQGPNETFDHVDLEIRATIKYAFTGLDLGQKAEDFLMKAFLTNMCRSEKLQKKLLASQAKQYNELLKICKADEKIERQSKDIRANSSGAELNSTSGY